VESPFAQIPFYSLVAGFGATVYGGYQCVEGHTYSVAAQHEATVVGRVVGISIGRGGSQHYNYVFSINGVDRDDFSDVCATPLQPGACDHRGPVLVYYTFQPFSNSRLEDFAVSSHKDFRVGIPALAIGFPLFLLSCAGIAIRLRSHKSSPDWPTTEATIQSVTNMSAANPDKIYAGDFTYTVNDDYFSGKLVISSSYSTHGASPKDLVGQKFRVSYNPRKPEKYSVPQSEIGGFLLDPYDETFG
jgi:hypothetical protein